MHDHFVKYQQIHLRPLTGYTRLPRSKFHNEWKSNQGNQDSSGNQKIVIQEQRQDTEHRQAQQRTYSNYDSTYKVTTVNEHLGLH